MPLQLPLTRAIVGAGSDYARTVAAGQAAVDLLDEAASAGRLDLSRKERQWLDRIARELAGLPADENELRASVLERHGELIDLASYGWTGGLTAGA